MSISRPEIQKYFFPATNNLHEEIVSLHDFVLPAATALWHFRSVIEQETRENPTVSAAELAIKYNQAPGTRMTTNLIVPFRDHDWEAQRERLAEVALVNIIALYEVWCEEICDILGRSDLAIKLQFPTNSTKTNGICFAISELKANKSTIIPDSIQPALRSSKKYSLQSLDSLMRCYRFFKETRNCLMHKGRTCDGKLWGAQSDLLPVATPAALGMDFVPEHVITQQSEQVQIRLHGVLGFTDVILRIATTVDAEVSATRAGEQILAERIADRTAPIRLERLPNLFTTIGWPSAILTPDLTEFLKRSGCVV